jgi:hypothetical protein
VDPPAEQTSRSGPPVGPSRGLEGSSYEFEAALRSGLVSDSALWPIRHVRARLLSEDRAYLGRSAKGWFFGFQIHVLIHRPTGVVLTAMLLPSGWDDRRAVRALALSTGGGVLLGDQGYSGDETFDWLCDEAQALRAGAAR